MNGVQTGKFSVAAGKQVARQLRMKHVLAR
jgi:hypothetical protein